jgi:hypothetical protein
MAERATLSRAAFHSDTGESGEVAAIAARR